jgi:hypothetical protein
VITNQRDSRRFHVHPCRDCIETAPDVYDVGWGLTTRWTAASLAQAAFAHHHGGLS